MDFIPYIVILLGIYGSKSVRALYCYNCVSLDKYNPDCIELKGQGEDNVNKYFIECKGVKNACSLYTGRFEDGRNKPRLVVTRKCDYMWDSEPSCRSDDGPADAGKNKGWTCKCTTDFCNWRDGVDIPLATVETSTHHPEVTTHSRAPTPSFSLSIFIVISFALIYVFI